MTKFAVLHTNKDFRTLYYRGKSQVHPGLVTYVRRNRLGIPRAGITASKKLGNAVQRNRCPPGSSGRPIAGWSPRCRGAGIWCSLPAAGRCI